MRRAALLLTALLLTALGGCRPLYLPPVPAGLDASPRLEFGRDSGLGLQGETLVLRLTLQRVPVEGWLALQWFTPDNRQAASGSVWLEPARVGEVLRPALPAEVTLTPGRWRVVASFAGEVVRQFDAEVAAPASP